MLTTEEEARRKSCPETAISEQCVGSACMAWRWHREDSIISAMRAIEDYGTEKAETQPLGYCGKAGRP